MKSDNGGEPVKVPFFSPFVRKLIVVIGVCLCLGSLFGIYQRITGLPYDFFTLFLFYFGGWGAFLCFFLYFETEPEGVQ